MYYGKIITMANNNKFKYKHKAKPQSDGYVPQGSEQSLATPIEQLGLSELTFNALKAGKLTTAKDLASRRLVDMYKIQNIGKKNCIEISRKLSDLGLAFRVEENKDEQSLFKPNVPQQENKPKFDLKKGQDKDNASNQPRQDGIQTLAKQNLPKKENVFAKKLDNTSPANQNNQRPINNANQRLNSNPNQNQRQDSNSNLRFNNNPNQRQEVNPSQRFNNSNQKLDGRNNQKFDNRNNRPNIPNVKVENKQNNDPRSIEIRNMLNVNKGLNDSISRQYAGWTLSEIIMGKRQRPMKPMVEKVQLTPESMVKFCRNGKWGYKDWKGNVIIQPVYDEACNFSEGLACVEKQGKMGFIDKKNNIVIDYKYDSATCFVNGLASVTVGEKSGYINKEGELKIPFIYDIATAFNEGKAVVKANDRWGVLSLNGEVFWR